MVFGIFPGGANPLFWLLIKSRLATGQPGRGGEGFLKATSFGFWLEPEWRRLQDGVCTTSQVTGRQRDPNSNQNILPLTLKSQILTS